MTNPVFLPAVVRSYPAVLDRATGCWTDLKEFLSGVDYGGAIETKRMAMRLCIADGTARFVCVRCKKPMILASVAVRRQQTSRFYFKHLHETGECGGVRGLSAREINALRFNHTKESVEHKRFKRLLMESLAHDPRATVATEEERWVDVDGVGWRQPDVQALLGGRRVAFEAQLSTTFLHVIAERMRFYTRNEGALIWLFRDLDPAHFRLSEDDIFYSNNRNAFRVTQESLRVSVDSKRLALECVWLCPTVTRTGVSDQVDRRIVYFDELIHDVSSYGVPRSYYFHYEQALVNVQRIADGFSVREQFEHFWLHERDDQDRWRVRRASLRKRGLDVPDDLTSNGFSQLLNLLYSVKHWRVVGFGFNSILEVAHYLVDRRKGFLAIFHFALTAFNVLDRFKELDTKGKFASKVAGYRAKLRSDPDYQFDGRFGSVASFLFPEIESKHFATHKLGSL